MIGIIDADTLLYAIGSINTSHVPTATLDIKIKNILSHLNIYNALIVIQGNRNFRNKHDINYKKHRTSEKPMHYHNLRKHLILNYQPFVANNIETDDVCAIAANYCKSISCDYTIIHLDKDLNQIPGKHYNYNTGVLYTVTEDEALYNLCIQLIKGDVTDSKITGIRGYGLKKAEKVLTNDMDVHLLTKVFNEFIIQYGEIGIEKFYTSYKKLKLIEYYPKISKKLKLYIDKLCNM